jgi:hypothetical protein
MERQRWTYRQTPKGHIIIFDQRGHPVTGVPGSPSDPRSYKNARAHLKRGCGRDECPGLNV